MLQRGGQTRAPTLGGGWHCGGGESGVLEADGLRLIGPCGYSFVRQAVCSGHVWAFMGIHGHSWAIDMGGVGVGATAMLCGPGAPAAQNAQPVTPRGRSDEARALVTDTCGSDQLACATGEVEVVVADRLSCHQQRHAAHRDHADM